MSAVINPFFFMVDAVQIRCQSRNCAGGILRERQLESRHFAEKEICLQLLEKNELGTVVRLKNQMPVGRGYVLTISGPSKD